LRGPRQSNATSARTAPLRKPPRRPQQRQPVRAAPRQSVLRRSGRDGIGELLELVLEGLGAARGARRAARGALGCPCCSQQLLRPRNLASRRPLRDAGRPASRPEPPSPRPSTASARRRSSPPLSEQQWPLATVRAHRPQPRWDASCSRERARERARAPRSGPRSPPAQRDLGVRAGHAEPQVGLGPASKCSLAAAAPAGPPSPWT
jgi:hypothetical protein